MSPEKNTLGVLGLFNNPKTLVEKRVCFFEGTFVLSFCIQFHNVEYISVSHALACLKPEVFGVPLNAKEFLVWKS